MSVLRASLGARVSCIYSKTCSVYFTVFIKQDVNIEAFHMERPPQVITLLSEEVAKLLRERTGPAFVRWCRIVVDSWRKVGIVGYKWGWYATQRMVRVLPVVASAQS
jgi:hypothetical protein